MEPLPENEKIPLSKPGWDGLLLKGDGTASMEDVMSVFCLAPDDFVDPTDYVFLIAASWSIHEHGTEDSFHGAWERNICKVLELCVPSGHSIRNSNRRPQTRGLRPSFRFLIGQTCPFRGEEKAPNSNEDPRRELPEKLKWMYDPSVPCILGASTDYSQTLSLTILGYFAAGTLVSYVAVTPPAQQGGSPSIHDLVQVDLRTRRQRIQNLVYLVNLSHLLQPLSQLMSSSESEFVSFSR